MLNPADLPDNIAALKALLVASEGRNLRKQDRIDQLERLVADFKHALFGARSEKTDPEQFELALEDIETAMAVVHAEDEAIDSITSRAVKPRNTNRGSLPKHLPRIEEVIEPEQTLCGCGAERHMIGEDKTERLDIIPAQFRVIVTRRPKYACGPARTASFRHPHLRGSFLAACRQRPRWRMCWSANTQIICPFIVRPRSIAAKASIWTVRPLRGGLAKQPMNCGLYLMR